MSKSFSLQVKLQKYEILREILIFVGISALLSMVGSLFGALVLKLFFDVPFLSLFKGELPQSNLALKSFQLISSAFTFLLPALVIPRFYEVQTKALLRIKMPKDDFSFIWSALIYFFALPFMGLLAYWNMQMSLPGWLGGTGEAIKLQDEEIVELTNRFLSSDSGIEMFLNILVVGVLPAIGEEFFFRGFLQRVSQRWGLSTISAILIVALLFSLVHLQFSGFLPRFFLGLLLGYLFYLTKSIWIPVFLHLIHNVSIVALAAKSLDPQKEISMNQQYIVPVVGLLIAALIVFYYSRKLRKSRSKSDKWQIVKAFKNRQEAQIYQGYLENEGVPSVLMDKKDSSYQFGEIDLLVNEENYERAIQFLQKKTDERNDYTQS